MIDIDSLVKENENREGRQEGRSAAGARPALAPGRWGGAGGGRGARAARGVRVSRPSCANRGVSALRVPACPCVSVTPAAPGLRGVALALGGSFSEPLTRGRPQRRSGRPGAAARSQGSQVAPLRRVLGWGRREPGPRAGSDCLAAGRADRLCHLLLRAAQSVAREPIAPQEASPARCS